MENRIYVLSNSYSLFKGEFTDKKYYLFNIEDGSIYRLNEVSYDMLALFDGNRDINMVFELFNNIYQGERNTMMSDFKKLLQVWLDKELLIIGGEVHGG